MSDASRKRAEGSDFEGLLTDIRDRIWERRPILGDIMRKHGDKTLFAYAKDFMDVNPAPLIDSRKVELIACATEHIEKRLGPDIASGVARQLGKLPLVSTADHHSPIDHPFWVNANIISSIPYREYGDPDIQFLIVFSFSSVSANNASGFPRGILFHGGADGSGPLIRLPLLPDKIKMGAVYAMRPYARSDIQRAEEELISQSVAGDVDRSRAERIRDVLETSFASPDVLSSGDLPTQITKINHRLWPRFFHTATGEESCIGVPQLIYLEIETLVSDLLALHHMREDTILHRVLFDPSVWPLVTKYFQNFSGAFAQDYRSGTYLFWAVDSRHHRVGLQLKDHALVSVDPKCSVSLELKPESIADALRKREIFPSMLLCYLTVAMYYGMKCLGGFCQVHDLTMIKQAWQALLKELGYDSESEALTPIQTKELGGDGMILSYVQTGLRTLVPATGLDMLLDASDTTFSVFERLAQRITLTEAMNCMLPEMYNVLYRNDERDERFRSLSADGILMQTGLCEKVLEAKLSGASVETKSLIGSTL